MATMLVTLIIVLCVIALFYWAVQSLPLPQPVRVIAVVVIALIGAVYLLSLISDIPARLG